MVSIHLALGIALLPALAPALPAQTWQEEQTRMDRDRPTLIGWQRSLDDALALSVRTGRPMLVCVNLDGENASEAFAHSKYKNPAFAALVERYVPLVISPNRHNPVDHDERGRRIECPRFGGVTCGEHIAPEQRAYELYFAGQRYAPRHVGVAPDGTILFDRFLDQDLVKVDRALQENDAVASGAWRDLVLSRDAEDRARLERAYLDGDAATRRELLAAARASDTEPYDLVRLGLADEDAELRAAAAATLARIAGPNGLDLVLEALRDERLEESREALVAALDRLGRTSERAKRAAYRMRALSAESVVVPLARWKEVLTGADGAALEPAPTSETVGPVLDELLAREESEGTTPELGLEVAAANLAMGRAVLANGGNPQFFFVDAEGAAERAREAGADARRAAAVASQAAWMLGEADRAGTLAAEALPVLLIERPASRDAAEVLAILANVRVRVIYAAEAAGTEWPAAELADALAAYDVLAAHPYGDAPHAIAHADLCATLELAAREGEVLRRALERFPWSPDLHQRFRSFVERTLGVPAFTREYERLLAGAADPSLVAWFAGYAELIVAESHARALDAERATASYDRAIELFDRSAAAHPDYADSVDHFAALALASKAALALARRDLDLATRWIAESIERRPASAETQDGLERTPLDTLKRVRRAIERAERPELEEELARRLGTAAPDVWAGLEGGS